MSDPPWRVIVVAPDTSVLAVSAAPESWVGMKADAIDAPQAVRRAAAALALAALPGRVGRAVVDEGGVRYEVLAVAGLVLRTAQVDLRALLTSALGPLQRQAHAADVSVSLMIPPELPPVPADADKLAWAVTTLVGSALRHTRRGSRLRPGGTIQVRVRHLRERSLVAVDVDDDGPGIPDEQVPWLFARRPGSPHAAGPAFALVKDVLEAHGGTMDVKTRRDALDHGTTVTLMLPLA